MSEFVHLKAGDVRRTPWKNGRGTTEELAIWPNGSSFERGDFGWRVSKSSVVEPGPFSTFPGVDRILVVTDGDGLVLDHGGAAPRGRLAKLTPYGFAGDWTTTAELTAGPVSDFNVFARRGVRRADVRLATPGRRPERLALEAGDALVHVLVGPMIARSGGDGRMFALGAGETLAVWRAKKGDEIELAGPAVNCAALFVRLRTD